MKNKIFLLIAIAVFGVIVYNEQSKPIDVIAENNKRAQSKIDFLKKSLKDGDSWEKENNLITIKRKNGNIEKYEIVSGIAGFTIVKVQ